MNKQTVSVFGIAAVLVGCTSVNVNRVEADKHQIETICIQENPKVLVDDFLIVLEDGFSRHGIESEVFNGEIPPSCEYRFLNRLQYPKSILLASANTGHGRPSVIATIRVDLTHARSPSHSNDGLRTARLQKLGRCSYVLIALRHEPRV